MKKLKKLFIMTVFGELIFCKLAIAQTNVSGFISSNTTWNMAGSPYIVTGNVLVSYGYTLTIDQGVTVKFNQDKAIQIDGELIAIGTAANRIIFTSNQATPFAGDWAKIHFADTSTNASFDTNGIYLSGSIMKYCDILYGGSLGFGEIHIESSSPYISNCRILYSQSDGIRCVGSSFLLDSSLVKDCGEYGIYFDSFFLNSCGLKINGDTIENNNTGGIKFKSASISLCPTLISNNYFISNSNNGAIDGDLVNFRNLVITKNYFMDNSAAVIKFYDLHGDTIDCNKFINNTSIGTCIYVYSYSSGVIVNNIFENNSGTSAILNWICSPDDFIFSNNYISNNYSSGLGSCRIHAAMTSTPKLFFDHNTLVNNSGVSALYLSSVNVSNSNLNFMYFKYNTFSNPGAQYELDNQIPYGSPNIYADNNYWGGTTTQHIDSVINDYFDFANQSVVYYTPILITPVAIDTTCPAFLTGIPNISNKDLSINIYPNPATTYINIDFNTIVNNGFIELYNTLGARIIKENISNNSIMKMEISIFPPGIYLLKLCDGGRYYSKKIIIGNK